MRDEILPLHDDPISESMPDTSRCFFFLRLPLELRRQVYQFVLVVDGQPLCHMGRQNRSGLQDATALLATSREIYLEARPIFLSKNTFLFRGTSTDYQWLKGRDPEDQQRLRRVSIMNASRAYNANNQRCVNILSKCPRLSLTVKATVPQLSRLEEMDVLKYLHGFSSVHVQKDGDISARYDQYVRMLARTFKLQCPENCRVHGTTDRAGYTATIDIDCRRE